LFLSKIFRVFDNCIQYNTLNSHYGHVADKMKVTLQKIVMKLEFEKFYDLDL